MPHRSPSCTGHVHEGGIVRIDTLRQSCDPDATGTLTISAIQSNIVKVEFVEGGTVTPEKSLVVLHDDVEGAFAVTETDAELHLLTSRIQVTVDKRTCALSYRDVNGTPRDNLWLRESPDGGKRLTPIDIERVICDEDAESTVEDSVDGLKVRTAAIGTVKDRDGFRAAHSFLLQEDEAVYGLGQHEEGFLSYCHRQQFLYQQNMKVAMPVMVSTKGYGIYWDTLALMTFNDLREETEVTIDAASSLRYYFIAGPAFDQIIGGIRHLSGEVPMLPRWAYGYLQSKERYETAQELIDVVGEYRERDIPLDCIILDWHSWSGDLWGQKTLDPDRFPDPQAMTAALHRHDVKLMVSIWPHMRGNGPNQVEMAEAGHLLGNKSTYDAYNEGQRSTGSDKRVVNLTRSGAVGQHRYNTITWSGDIEARWSRLRKQIADGLNFTITGSPRWTWDIGAFFVKPGTQWFWDGQYPEGNQDPGYRELYLRWLQASVFLPIFRSHGTDTAREVWRFGKPGEPYYDAIKASIELRYRLLPYLYSLAGWECQRGYTTFRNLAFDFREDPETHDIADQFMCGPSLMVCPVLAPQEYGPDSAPITDAPKQRKVYLPTCHNKGTFWYDFHTHKRYEGGEWIDVDTPINRIPVFAPAGSIDPLGPVVRHASESCDAPWVLRVFPGADGSFDIDGDGLHRKAKELERCGRRVRTVVATIEDVQQITEFFELPDREFEKIDILANVAYT